MVKLSRYILVLTGVLVASVSIPALFWVMFEKVPVSPTIFYSCVIDDFVIIGSSKTDDSSIRLDGEGNKYTNAEYEEIMPLMFFRQLVADGKMPDSIKGVPMEPALINRYNSFHRFNPRNFDSPAPALFPMFESQSGRVNLTMPDDYFRIGKQMEFLTARTNKVDTEKSNLFSTALEAKGFVFPADLIAGIPTTRKSKDEGYFVTDSDGKLFHIKMIQGVPFVEPIKTPEGFEIIHIECVDMRTSEFYAFIYTRSHGVFVLMDEVYDLQRLPVEGFNPYFHTLRVNGDVFNKCISWSGENWIKAIAVDDMYEVVHEYEESWGGKWERTDGRLFSAIFPFEISLTSNVSSYKRFHFGLSPGYKWIIANIILVIAYSFFLFRRKRTVSENLIDLAIVGFTGIYGLIIIFVYPNRFRK